MNSQAASAEVNDSIRPQAKGGSVQCHCSPLDGLWSRLAMVLEYPLAKTPEQVIDHAQWLVESYHAMCGRLQDAVQKHKLGLGGERIDILVCEALDCALSANNAISKSPENEPQR